MHRVLKSTGALYLHCDPSAGHYLKLLLDAVFGPENFRNEIVWRRTPFAGSSKARARQFPRSHDLILFYTKGATWTWDPPTKPYTEKYLKRFKWDDHNGRGPYRKTLLKTYSDETFERLKQDNRLIAPVRQGAKWSYKQYLSQSSGKTQIDDVWTDINSLNPVAKERIGFPTQKPTSLLKRIIEASTDKGDLVLDPFCGCGSTIEAAHETGRKWIGIDITHLAIEVIGKRLTKLGLKEEKDYVIDSRFAPPTLPDIEMLARKDKHTFQGWALQQAGIEAFQLKPGPDRGIDARKVFFDPPGSNERREIIVSVKGGQLPATCVRDLIGTVHRERAHIGVLITLNPPTRNMVRDAAEAPAYRGGDRRIYSGIQILTVKDLLDGHTLEYPLQLAASSGPTIPQPTAAARTFQLEMQAPERKMAKAALPLGFAERRQANGKKPLRRMRATSVQ
jgi:adenine specific DNA methylase Mod